MAIKLIGNKSYGNAGDGIRIQVSGDFEVTLEDNITHDNGGQGLHIIENLTPLYEAGINASTPFEEIQKAHEELLKSKPTSDQQIIKILEEIGFSKWIQHGANIATIGSLLLQIFSK